jgi:hypothetical protein
VTPEALAALVAFYNVDPRVFTDVLTLREVEAFANRIVMEHDAAHGIVRDPDGTAFGKFFDTNA